MFNSFLSWFFETILIFFTRIINIVTYPILALLRSAIPNFNNYFSMLNNFLDNYFFKGLQFAKMLFVNFFQINHTIFYICFLIFVLSASIFLSTRSIKLGINIWSIKNNGMSKK